MVKGLERRTERFTLRVPPSLHEAIKKAALKDKRSVADWVVVQLEIAVKR